MKCGNARRDEIQIFDVLARPQVLWFLPETVRRMNHLHQDLKPTKEGASWLLLKLLLVMSGDTFKKYSNCGASLNLSGVSAADTWLHI